MARIIAIANHKGGVGKTSTCYQLSHALAGDGKRTVLLCDLDPQASLTKLLLSTDQLPPVFHDLLLGRGDESSRDEAVLATDLAGVCLLPAHPAMANVDMELTSRMNRERILHRLLRPIAERFDLVLLDCPPALNLLTTNALAAADEVLIPVEAGYLELQALDSFLETVDAVRRELNPTLRVRGILITKHREGSAHDREIVAALRASLPESVLRSVIPYSGRAKESLAERQSIFTYDPHSSLAAAYRSLAAELVEDHA